jgi:hypothetical protein
MPIIRRSVCFPLPIVVCPVVAVVMQESRVARCVHCVETVHTSCQPTLQHNNSYNRTDNYRQWNAVGSPDDGHKDARNILRYYWLPINQYLLHLVGFSFTYKYTYYQNNHTIVKTPTHYNEGWIYKYTHIPSLHYVKLNLTEYFAPLKSYQVVSESWFI